MSVRGLLRLALYGGVVLLAGGIGLFLKENHERLGPALIAALAGAAALGCFAYVVRRSPPFSWGKVESPHIAVDYLLLLAVLLFASDLAYVEAQFRILGPQWSWHLFLVAAVAFAAAYRYDSRSVLTLALTSFAAWRGVSAGMPFVAGAASAGGGSPGAVRANAIACGILYVAAGAVSVRLRKKAHFEPVWTTAGLLLLFGAALSGAWASGPWFVWEVALVLLAGAVLAAAYRMRRPLEFAIGVAAIYLAGMRILSDIVRGPSGFLLVAGWSIAALIFLISATRRLRRAA